MKKITLPIAIAMLLVLPMLSGCIGGGDDDKTIEAWDGDIEDLLLTADDLDDGYEVETETYTDPDEFADDTTALEEHGFVEGAMSDFGYYDWENLVIGAQMVLRFDPDEMDGLLDDFKDSIDEDEGTTYEEINLGSYGDETLSFVITDSDLEGYGAYAIGFVKQDIMVFIMTVSMDDDGDLVKSLAEAVLDKF
ncbi:MAG TPA: hypothetical protein PK718_08390 [Candidatus Methanofastidiosa archaeon]|nr:hypothetical protein [Candidatus Methanofastidiosa archaeon]